MEHWPVLQASIDYLHANVAVLDDDGGIVRVNERWRRFGGARDARSDYVGLNYLKVCAESYARGDQSAMRVERGLWRLLDGNADSFGMVYHCAERTFRMQARRLDEPIGGLIVAHEDITRLLRARHARRATGHQLSEAEKTHRDQLARTHEELGQRLAAISLAMCAIENGGNVSDAVMLMRMALDEARHELELLRYTGTANGVH